MPLKSMYAPKAPEWVDMMSKSLHENYLSNKIYHPIVQGVFVNVNGMPIAQPLAFQGLLDVDPRLIMFSCSVLNADLMGTLKSNAPCQVIFSMPKTGELIYIGGKMVSVTSSQYMYRFGAPPRKAAFAAYTVSNPLLADALSTHADFWEEERMRQFLRITDRYRATFTWPGPSEPLYEETNDENYFTSPSATPPRSPGARKPVQRIRSFSGVDFGYKYTTVSAPATSSSATQSLLNTANASSDMECAKTVAKDNFALLVLRPSSVDFTVPNKKQPSGGAYRTIWEMDSKTGDWLKQTVNPYHLNF